jgi:hypothetical protein
VFFTAQACGTLSAWDLVYKHSEPTLEVQVSDQQLTALALQDGGAVLGCGTADGCCSVMQLSGALVDMVPNEKQTVSAMLEREILRCVVARALAGRGLPSVRQQAAHLDVCSAGAHGLRATSALTRVCCAAAVVLAARRTWRRRRRRPRSRRAGVLLPAAASCRQLPPAAASCLCPRLRQVGGWRTHARAGCLCCMRCACHAGREAARTTMMADTVTDDDLAAVEDAFLKATGAPAGLELLAQRRAAAAAAESSEVHGSSAAAAAHGRQGGGSAAEGAAAGVGQ